MRRHPVIIYLLLCPLLLLAAWGCDNKPSSAPKAQTTPGVKKGETPSGTATSSGQGAPEIEALVWSRKGGTQGDGSQDVLETRWLAVRGDTIEEVARRDGLVVAAEGKLWTITHARSVAEIHGCDEGSQEVGPKRKVELVELRVAELGAKAGAASSVVVDLIEPPKDDPEAGMEYSEQIGLLGTLGPYLFVEASTYFYSCGAAHGNGLMRFELIDLRNGKVVKPELEGEAELKKQAFATMQKSEAGADLHTESAEKLLRTKLHTALGDDGRLKLMVQYTADTCYACSDGKWSPYTMSQSVEAGSWPKVLGGFAAKAVPAALAKALASARGEEASAGLSTLALEGQARSEALAAFKASE